MSTISFFVQGRPSTAGSKTVGHTKAGHHYVRHASKFTKNWMELVRDIAAIEYKNQPLTTGPIELCLCFFLEHPKSHYRAGKFKHLLKSDAPLLHTIKPDLTKLVRAVEDALTGVIWKDDSQVSSACSLKQYAPFGSKPGVRIIVRSGG